MKNKNKKIWGILILTIALMATLALAGCSSDQPTEVPADSPAVPPETNPDAIDVLPTAAPEEATMTAKENLRVRSGPSQLYPIYKKIAGGQTAKLLGISADGTYYAIEMPIVAPNTGWVDVNFAEVSNPGDLPVIPAPPLPPTAEFIGVQPGDPTLIATDAVYVRSGPDNQYPAYGIAEVDSKALAIGVSEDGNWWVVRLNPKVVGKGYGWVQKEFVTTENVGDDLAVIKTPPLPIAGELPPPNLDGPYGVATDYLNIRSGPGTNYPTLVVAAPNATGEITGKSVDGLWWQIKISTDYSTSGLAWAHGAYVVAHNVENIPVVEAPPVPPTNPDPPEDVYSCLLVSQSPVDGTSFEKGTSFDMAWEVENIGAETWTTANTVITKVGVAVDQPLSEVDTLALAVDVKTGETYIVTVPMKAPDYAGQFGEYWTIVADETTVCYFYNVIQVVE